MKQAKTDSRVKIVELPWSHGAMSAKVWHTADKTIACVPELGLHCYGISEREASFRLFTVLLKYYSQLKLHKNRLGARGQGHLELLSNWMVGVENRIRLRKFEPELVIAGRYRD